MSSGKCRHPWGRMGMSRTFVALEDNGKNMGANGEHESRRTQQRFCREHNISWRSFDGNKFTTFTNETKWLDYGPDDYAGITSTTPVEGKYF